MSWRALAVTDVQFSPAEMNMLNSAQGVTNGLANKLTMVTREFIGAMAANMKQVNTDGTVPDQLRRHIIALAVWTWLREFPQLKAFQTDSRRKAAEDAESIYEEICSNTYGAIESPLGADFSQGNWNSKPKMIGRMNPIPPPSLQLQVPGVPIYANPNAPTDTVDSNSIGLPPVPENFQAQAGNSQVLLSWNQALGAVTFNIYRSTISGSETLLVAAITATNYTDTGLTNGVPVYYQIASVNTVGVSTRSLETSATPLATLP